MSRNMSLGVSVCGTICLLATSGTASAQFYGPAANPCGCVQPVAQPCYQTVPVTEYRQMRQTVQRPVYETKYVDQQVTQYRPVVEQRTASVPTVSYENVTEMQTVSQNAGYWQVSKQCNPKVSPCQYDNRPGFLGWMNRTGYSMRSAFTPAVTTRRQFIPQTIVQQVPVTRQVARPGTQQVVYNVTTMVPETTTQKVAVNSVRYVAEEIVTQQPVTVMRSVPIGSSIAYLPMGATSSTALLPVADPIGAPRSADSTNSNSPQQFQREAERDATNIQPKSVEDEFGLKKSSYSPPQQEKISVSASNVKQLELTNLPIQTRPAATLPSVVRVSRWVPTPTATAGPTLESPAVSVAVSAR